MALSPDMRRRADALAAAVPGGLTALPLAAMRQAADQLPASPVTVARVTETTVPGPGGPVPVRVYRRNPAGPAPALLWLHGGGFVLGSLAMGDDLCRRLANATGAVVVNVAYRLAPEHPYPSALEDCAAVYRWAHRRPDALGPVTGLVAAGGDSAGGNLAMALALRARDDGLPPMACQLSVYGTADMVVTNPELGDVPFLTAGDCHWFWDRYVPDPARRADPHVNPARAASLQGLPPLLAITAEHDPTRDGTEEYARRVAAAGGHAIIRRYPGMAHGFFLMPDLEQARAAFTDATAFLTEYLRAG